MFAFNLHLMRRRGHGTFSFSFSFSFSFFLSQRYGRGRGHNFIFLLFFFFLPLWLEVARESDRRQFLLRGLKLFRAVLNKRQKIRDGTVVSYAAPRPTLRPGGHVHLNLFLWARFSQ